jgi:hypothetical protein
MVSNSLVLRFELNQLVLSPSIGEYLLEGWNQIDLVGIIALYVACAAHFLDSPAVLSQVGAIGVLLNSGSILKLLQPLQKDIGTLIKVITMTSKAPEVLGFGLVMLVLIYGFGAAFIVSMPTNDAFYTANATIWPGVLTTSMAVMAQDFKIDDYEVGVPLVMFVLFLYIVIIVMFNVLIAIVSELYTNVMVTADVEVYQRRAEAIIAEEALMSPADLVNKAFFPQFLEVLQVAAGEEKVEQVKVSEVQEDVAQLHATVEEVRTELKDEIGKMTQQMSKLEALVVQVLEQGRKPTPAASGFHSAVGQVMARSRGGGGHGGI